MHDDHTVPRYTIKYLDPVKGWTLSPAKFTLRFAAIQYAGLEWDPVMESEEYVRPQDLPIVGSAAKFLGPKK